MAPKISRFLRSDNAWGAFCALAAFLVYLTTLAPSLGFIDAGELAASAYTFGVAHPTGYPLFTLVAGVFSRIPLGDSVIWRLNLFAALCCAVSVFFFFRVFLDLLRRASSAPSERDFEKRLAAAAATLALAFSRTFWAQATNVEVYSLHLLLVSLILFTFLRALPGNALAAAPAAKDKPAKKTAKSVVESVNRKRLFLFAFVLGLGFTNHLTTLLLLPVLAWMYFTAYGWKRRGSWRAAGFALPFFFAALCLYLYLPLRAAAWPELNWGAIVDLESLRWHVTGKQYSGWMFSSLEPAGRNFALFLNTWPGVFGYLALALAVLGWGTLFARARRVFLFSALLFAGCLAYAVNYDISDVVNYFLLAHVATALAAAFGASFLLEKARALGGAARAAAVVVCAAAAALPLALNHREVDERGNHAVEDYARELLGSVEPNAVILTYDWDLFVAGAWYLQAVERYRPDVLVVDRELLRRAWYLRKLRHDHPDFTEGSAGEIEAFKLELRAFDLGLPYDGAVIQGRFEAMIRALLQRAAAGRPVYAAYDIEANYLQGFEALPAGGLLRLIPPGVPPDSKPRFMPREFVFRPFPKDNPYFRMLRQRYATAYLNQALFFASINELEGCRHFLGKALEVDPSNAQARGYLQQLQQLQAAQPQAPSQTLR